MNPYTCVGAPEVPPDPSILERNLAALARASPGAVEAIRRSSARPEARFVVADDGAVSGSVIGPDGVERQLASRRRPFDEAVRLAEGADIESNGGFAVLGFGLGHHVAALAARVRRAGVLYILEPDAALLKAVLERVDHSAWMKETNAVVFTNPDDPAAISASTRGVEALLALGVKFIEHPPSMPRLGPAATVFSDRLLGVMKALRTTVVTTMVQVQTTLRNTLMNAARYASCPGVGELDGMFRGRPAVVVSAGPSLSRNVRELGKPGVRDRVVIIAVQTVLKTLLNAGIVPHFVTALDYSDLSARFYEGVSAADVEGCTLVVEPMASPSILRAYPGQVRCPGDRNLDLLLGDAPPEEYRKGRGELKLGATVAHLAYYLARHLGCDPVILVGQDLGFTDGQYYSAGAAIHRVWSGELNDFNTLEMLEWQRIARGKSLLHKATDVLGRPIYTDEQMATYLAQFERDFAEDQRAGLRIIDATEGGVAKRHTTNATLAEALALHAPSGVDPIVVPAAPAHPKEREIRRRVGDRVRSARGEAHRVASIGRKAAEVLEKLRARLDDRAEAERLITEVHALRDRATALKVGFGLTQFLNQTGTFNRIKADRAIGLEPALTAVERQARQVDRDIQNVMWIADAAGEVVEMLDDTARDLAVEPGAASARGPSRAGQRTVESAPPPRVTNAVRARRRVVAVLQVDPERGGLGTARDLSAPLARGRNALQLTVRRLLLARELDRVVVACVDAACARSLLGVLADEPRVAVVGVDGRELGAWGRWVGAARAFAARSWRGGIGGMSVFDEACCAAVALGVLDAVQADACVVVGADWALVDPQIVDRVIERHRESPDAIRFAFAPAPPGLGACLVTREILAELAARRGRAPAFATLGALLGYIPIAPQADPIAKPMCVTVPAAVRDLTERCIPDSPSRRERFGAMIERAAGVGDALGCETLAEWLNAEDPRVVVGAPDIVRIELTTARAEGLAADWHGVRGLDVRSIPVGRARAVIEEIGSLWPGAAVAFEGRGDPLSHPHWRDVLGSARSIQPAAIHVRTESADDEAEFQAAVERADVLSVDLWGTREESARSVGGRANLARATMNIRRVVQARGEGALGSWIVPRLTRCDEVYGEVEGFFDFWLMETGAAVIDALPRTMPGRRIAPLPRPANVTARDRASVLVVRADGSVASDPAEPWDSVGGGGEVGRSTLDELWRRQVERWSADSEMGKRPIDERGQRRTDARGTGNDHNDNGGECSTGQVSRSAA